eukprot:TRINITY_DN14003_c0_g1_i1.p1 TRINITY_DN14003_c0_g1~~TRINITY_DN14003_c0_g1_i1.p1  ORF type:complete len:107 (-),score=31.19 TRINITY_DN14003_c0_g1_i1:208-528(-)
MKVITTLLVICLIPLVCKATISQPRLPPDTVISGNPPIPKNQGVEVWAIEAVSTRLSFTRKCGAPTARPTCNCTDGSQFRHPYFVALCSDGTENTFCACPDGSSYP